MRIVTELIANSGALPYYTMARKSNKSMGSDSIDFGRESENQSSLTPLISPY